MSTVTGTLVSVAKEAMLRVGGVVVEGWCDGKLKQGAGSGVYISGGDCFCVFIYFHLLQLRVLVVFITCARDGRLCTRTRYTYVCHV